MKQVGRVTMDDLVAYLAGTLTEWPAMQLQALEIILNSPFINNDSLLYISRTLFPAGQARPSPHTAERATMSALAFASCTAQSIWASVF